MNLKRYPEKYKSWLDLPTDFDAFNTFIEELGLSVIIITPDPSLPTHIFGYPKYSCNFIDFWNRPSKLTWDIIDFQDTDLLGYLLNHIYELSNKNGNNPDLISGTLTYHHLSNTINGSLRKLIHSNPNLDSNSNSGYENDRYINSSYLFNFLVDETSTIYQLCKDQQYSILLDYLEENYLK